MLFPTASLLWPAMSLHSEEGLSVVSSQIAVSICPEEIKYDSNWNREKRELFRKFEKYRLRDL